METLSKAKGTWQSQGGGADCEAIPKRDRLAGSDVQLVTNSLKLANDFGSNIVGGRTSV